MNGWDKEKISQLQLPIRMIPTCTPGFCLTGMVFMRELLHALMPDGWHDITLEVRMEPTGPGCWYISTPEYRDICPVGLFVKV